MFAFMKAKESEKRYSNSYKCTTKVYNKAMRRAKKEKIYLSNLIEDVVSAYAKGDELYLFVTNYQSGFSDEAHELLSNFWKMKNEKNK